MKISEEIRSAYRGEGEKSRMADKAREFAERGGEVYS